MASVIHANIKIAPIDIDFQEILADAKNGCGALVDGYLLPMMTNAYPIFTKFLPDVYQMFTNASQGILHFPPTKNWKNW
jgi:hypothetical protein